MMKQLISQSTVVTAGPCLNSPHFFTIRRPALAVQMRSSLPAIQIMHSKWKHGLKQNKIGWTIALQNVTRLISDHLKIAESMLWANAAESYTPKTTDTIGRILSW